MQSTSRELICAAGLSRVAALILTVVAAGRLLIGDRVLGLALLLVVAAIFTVSTLVVRRARRTPGRRRTPPTWSAVARTTASPGVASGLAQPAK